MIDRKHELSISAQAKLLGISRGTVYYLPRPVSDADLALMRRIDELHLQHPFMGARMLRDQLAREGVHVGRRHLRTLMKRMGIEALAPQPGTSGSMPFSVELDITGSDGPARCTSVQQRAAADCLASAQAWTYAGKQS